MLLDEQDRRLIDGWQRDLPIVSAPFAAVGATLGLPESDVLARLARLQQSGALSRVGAVVRPNTVGASTLAAISVPPERLEAAAAAIVVEPGVNHAYEREHAYNLWFVVTAPDATEVAEAIVRIEQRAGAPVLQVAGVAAGGVEERPQPVGARRRRRLPGRRPQGSPPRS